MLWIQKGNEFLPNTEKSELKKLYESEKKAKPQLRLLVAILRKEGKTLDEIASVVNKPKTTIHDWLKRFQVSGLEMAYDLKKSGRPAKLTKKQKQKLEKIIEESPEKQGLPFVLWTTSLVQYIIHKLFDIVYKIRNIEYLVKELGFSMQKPRPENIKANKKLQKKFKIDLKKKLNVTLNLDLRSFVLTKHTSLQNHT